MARGNCYLVIAAPDKGKNIPPTMLARHGWEETVTDPVTGKVTRVPKNPTWTELGEHNRGRFGAVRNRMADGVDHLIIETEFSFLKGDMAEVVKLQKANRKDFRILTNSEAQAWLAGDDTIF